MTLPTKEQIRANVANLTEGFSQLEDCNEAEAKSKTSEVIRRGEFLIQAIESFQEAKRELAYKFLDETGENGWTFDEFWQTDLRGDKTFLNAARVIGG